MKELDDKFFLIYIKGYNLAVFLAACVFFVFLTLCGLLPFWSTFRGLVNFHKKMLHNRLPTKEDHFLNKFFYL